MQVVWLGLPILQLIEIFENIEGFKFSAEKINNRLVFYKSNNVVISVIDRTLFAFLEYPIKFFNSLDIDLFPNNYKFNFEY
jgi:hypothetical protein